MIFLCRLWRIRPRLILAMFSRFTNRVPAYGGGSGRVRATHWVAKDRSDAEHSSNSFLFTLEKYRFLLERSLARSLLVKELVGVMRLPSRYLARSRYLEALHRCLVRLQLCHLFS